MRKRGSFSFKRLTDEVAINLNMLSALMEDEIDWNVNDTSVYSRRATWREAKFSQ